MISTPTVLVLGAGASYPYGYPLGSDLVSLILNHTAPETPFASTFMDRGDIAGFRRRLAASEVGSIDEFLEANMEFAELGRLAIAAALTVYGPDSTTQAGAGAHWMHYLWTRLKEGAPTSAAFAKNSLRLVTYNYEDSFHRYIRKVIQGLYKDMQEVSETRLKDFAETSLPIVHLHGSLNHADDAAIVESERRSLVSASFLDKAAKGLRIIHEEELSEEYQIARHWLAEAKRIYFLGFGYHPTNCKRLGITSVAGDQGLGRWQAIQGTTYGMRDAEKRRASRSVGIPSQNLHDLDCLAFLRQVALLD